MKVNYQFSVNGLGEFVKTKLYKIVPADVSGERQPGDRREFHEAMMPLVGTLANESGSFLRDFNSRNIVCPIVFLALGRRLVIPEAVVSVTRKKRVVKTEVVGGSGTVKEFIGDDDMDISITVGITATDAEGNIIDEYPGDAISELQEFLDAKTLDVWSPFLELFDINGGMFKIVVEKYTVAQTTHRNHQIVNIDAISDFDYTILNIE